MHMFIRIMHGWIPGCIGMHGKCMEVYKGTYASKYISG